MIVLIRDTLGQEGETYSPQRLIFFGFEFAFLTENTVLYHFGNPI